MTDDDLKAIEARAAAAVAEPVTTAVRVAGELAAEDLLKADVPALVAEVRRLRAIQETWRSWAQFVWLGGGESEGTDDDLRRRVCEAADRDEAGAA